VFVEQVTNLGVLHWSLKDDNQRQVKPRFTVQHTNSEELSIKGQVQQNTLFHAHCTSVYACNCETLTFCPLTSNVCFFLRFFILLKMLN